MYKFCYSIVVSMRKKVLFALIFLLSVSLGGALYYYKQSHQALGIVSPLAEDALAEASQYRAIFDRHTIDSYPPNEFFPKVLTPKFDSDLGVDIQAYAAMDRDTGELLLAKNITEELPIASVTKIMTAIVALENSRLSKEIRVSSASASIGEAEMGLTSGEKVTVEDLLYGLMLPSANDAAETLAEGVTTGRTAFIIKMNETAQRLGLLDTFYFNPSGLDGQTEETSNFSTCLDLLALTNYALTNPKFAEVVSTYYKEIPYEENKHKAFYLYNILQLDRSYPGIKGVKPGNTDFAQETLVSYAENGGKKIIMVLLGSGKSRDDAIKIYDYLFPQLGVTIAGRNV